MSEPGGSEGGGVPPQFRRAVATLQTVRPRPELRITAVDAPPRLAPYTWAFGVEADATAGRPGEALDDLDEPDTSGRLILLHDPAGQDAWAGMFRLVCFVQARLEPEQLGDEMFPVVGWSWLTEALELHRAEHVALGGTVTQTSSVRFGETTRSVPSSALRPPVGLPANNRGSNAPRPHRDDDVELRASWTPVGVDLRPHAEAFCALVASAAGLTPASTLSLAERPAR